MNPQVALLCTLLVSLSVLAIAFTPKLAFTGPTRAVSQTSSSPLRHTRQTESTTSLQSSVVYIVLDDDDDDDDENNNNNDDDDEEEEEEEEEEADPYTKLAESEFKDPEQKSSALATLGSNLDSTLVDWGGALGKLRERMGDVESGKSSDPSHALFRMMSSQTPNQVIGQFITTANPQVVQAMSGAVGSLLGGLSNPNMGVETVVKATGDKVGSLCFQLQMTGYMFRNAEYVLALKEIMDLRGKVSLKDYKKAFDRLDKDGSGYIETKEIQTLFDEVYDGKAPAFEVDAFMNYFDSNNDGKISWDEFEHGLGAAYVTQMEKGDSAARLLGQSLDDEDDDDDDDDDEDDEIELNSQVSGTIQIEMEDGKVIEVEAKEYIESLKAEAAALKEALRKEKSGGQPGAPNGAMNGEMPGMIPNGGGAGDPTMDITGYIASRQGDVKSLTEGISPEVMETMKKLVDFVLEGGESGKARKNLTDEQKASMEMEIPGVALQQLALWQLVLGYRLREAEVKGDYLKLLQ